jgi:voltage-gated potassium channel
VSTDAANVFITLTGRSMRPDLFIVSRAREDSSAAKLQRAGADRVVNPQEIGGAASPPSCCVPTSPSSSMW